MSSAASAIRSFACTATSRRWRNESSWLDSPGSTAPPCVRRAIPRRSSSSRSRRAVIADTANSASRSATATLPFSRRRSAIRRRRSSGSIALRRMSAGYQSRVCDLCAFTFDRAPGWYPRAQVDRFPPDDVPSRRGPAMAHAATRDEHAHSGTTREEWRNTVLAGLANYIDAGSIVAGAAGLTLWTKEFGLSSSFVGLIGAFSSNAISAGVGALVGGWLCDQYGRKPIYQWDLLVYAFGLLWIIFAQQPWMLVSGYVLAGLAVGADVPASWTLIAETAPDKERGKHAGVAQVLWMMGPVVVLLLALALSGLGVLGVRIVFAHLFVGALVLGAMRRRMSESKVWSEARGGEEGDAPHVSLGASRVLLANRRFLGPLAFLTGMY